MKIFRSISIIGMVIIMLLSTLILTNDAGGDTIFMDTYLRDSHWAFYGEDDLDQLGRSVSNAGDVNGDGRDDIILGAPNNDEGGTDAGQTYLIFGYEAEIEQDRSVTWAAATFIGEELLDQSGYSVSGVGDVDDDGFCDFIIGSRLNDQNGADSGKTYLIYGKKDGWSHDLDLSEADAAFVGESGGDRSGYCVSGAGDVNGDGFDDLLIGAPYNDDGGTYAGKTYLIFGNSWRYSGDISLSSSNIPSFVGEDYNDLSGSCVAGAGDFNGDGYDDILIGAYRNDTGGDEAGKVYVICGKTAGWRADTSLLEADISFTGENSGDHAGVSLSVAGDVNGDGYDDILIGADYNSEEDNNAGQTYLVFGRPSYWGHNRSLSYFADASFLGENGGDLSGRSVSVAGDVNDDGIDDILIGAPGRNEFGPDTGQTYLILGKETGWGLDVELGDFDASYVGEQTSDLSGNSVSGAGDFNGDGIDDILIGATGNDDGGDQAGKVYVVYYNSRPVVPGSIEAETDIGNNKISISWDSPNYWRTIDKFNIHRSENGIDFNKIGSVPRSRSYARSFVDTHVRIGTHYWYAIEVIGGSGESSGIRDPVKVLFDRDTDSDGIGDTKDPDIDGDGIPHNRDADTMVKDPVTWSGGGSFEIDGISIGFIGEEAGDKSSMAIAGGGDVNGDGFDDLLIGAPENDETFTNAGQTYLILGDEDGWDTDIDLNRADASFLGESGGDHSGYSIDIGGDLNNDGFDDIIIGAFGNNEEATYAGQTYVIFGKESGWTRDASLSNSDASFLGEDQLDISGRVVVGVGDVDRDNYDDFLICSPQNGYYDTGSGQVYLIYGKNSGWSMDTSLSDITSTFVGTYSGINLGISASGGGDINGDGYDDILLGSKGYVEGGNAEAYLFYGKISDYSNNTLSTNADTTIKNDIADEGANSMEIAGGGDLNGDGYDDVMIGIIWNDTGGTNSGISTLFYGNSSWDSSLSISDCNASFYGEAPYDASGDSIKINGDINGDGCHDILIGAYGNDDGGVTAGKGYLILGSMTDHSGSKNLSSADFTFEGENALDGFGDTVAYGGDLKGNGMDAILLGAMGHDDGGSNAGKTYLINVAGSPVTPEFGLHLSSEGTGIVVQWSEQGGSQGLHGLYRGPHPGLMRRIGLSDDHNYTDHDVIAGNTYFYSVTQLGAFGDESPMASPLSLVADVDTDGDGIGNMADTDDDNDMVLDGEDMFPFNSTEHLDTDLDGWGNNYDPDDDNDGILDIDDEEPLNPMNGLSRSFTIMNTTLEDIALNITFIRYDISVMNANLSDLMMDFNDIYSNIMEEMDALMMKLTIINDSNDDRTDDLIQKLNVVNSSLHSRFDELQGIINDLGIDLMNALQQTRIELIDLQMNMSVELDEIHIKVDSIEEMVEDLNLTIDSLEKMTLKELHGMLVDLSTQMNEMGMEQMDISQNLTDLLVHCDQMRSDTQNSFDELISLLEDLDEIENGIQDIQSQQQGIEDQQSTASIIDWLLILLMIVMVILLFVLLLRKRSGSDIEEMETVDEHHNE